MSRIIIKSLPKAGVKEDQLKKIFGEYGTITDCSLKYTKEGKFRQFAFIGYENETQATLAVSKLNKSFIGTNRIQVEPAADFGAESKPRAWSKYSKDSSAAKKLTENSTEAKDKKKKEKEEKKLKKQKAKEEKLNEMLGDLKDDPEFKEFLEVHKNRKSKATWKDDTVIENELASDTKQKENQSDSGSESVSGDEGENDDDDASSESDDDSPKETDKPTTSKGKSQSESEKDRRESALEFLKSKMSKSHLVSDSESSSSESESEEEGESEEEEKMEVDTEDGDKDDKKKAHQVVFVVKMKGLSPDVEEKQIENFFKPLKPVEIKVPRNEKTNKSYKFAIVMFASDKDTDKAMKKHENMMDSKKINLFKVKQEDEKEKKKKEPALEKKKKKKKEKKEEKEKMEADIAEDEGIAEGEPQNVQFVVKMKGLPPNVKEKQIAEFFKPLNPVEIKVPRSAKGNNSFSFATVEFSSDAETDDAMKRTKNFIGPKKIYLYKVKREVKSAEVVEKGRPWESKIKENMETNEEDESIAESGRIFVRNLAFISKETDLEELFGKYGPLTEVHLPVDNITKKVKGFAFITFMMPEHAVKAYSELDGTVFLGRMLHILPGKAKKEEEELPENAPYKKKKEAEMKKLAGSAHNWNTLFVGANSVVDVMADKYGTTKDKILDAGGKHSLGVRMALGETQVVAEIREFLVENGVVLDSFSQAAAERSKTVILIKNLPAGTQAEEMKDLFSRYGTLGRVLLPPAGVTAIVEFAEPSEARNAFRNLAYTKFQHLPLYLEWAPMEVFTDSPKSTSSSRSEVKEKKSETKKESANKVSEKSPKKEEQVQSQKEEEKEEEEEEEEEEAEMSGDPQNTLFVKNLNFNTTEDTLQKKFSKCGRIKEVSVAKKKDLKNPGKMLSMGYGFVEFKKKESAEKALKELQHCALDGHQLELKMSNRSTIKKPLPKKKQEVKQQTSSKILVRNIPFEAKAKEVQELFGTFGELKTVRLPQKVGGTGSHRGFGFVDYLTKQDAKRAFNALCHDTHLYGRRLVLEWANNEESVEQLREKTAQHFHDGGPSKKLRKTALIEELHLGKAK